MKKRRTDSDEKAKSSKQKKATRALTSVDGHLSMFADVAAPLFLFLFCFCFCFCLLFFAPQCKCSSEANCSLGVVFLIFFCQAMHETHMSRAFRQ